jgi:hypothetical protein
MNLTTFSSIFEVQINSFFLNYKRNTTTKNKANKLYLVDFLVCFVALWSLKALTGVKNLPHFFKTQSSEGQEIGGREIGIGRPYKKKIGG